MHFHVYWTEKEKHVFFNEFSFVDCLNMTAQLFVFLFLLLLLFIFRLFVRFLFIQGIYWRKNVRLFYRNKHNRSWWIDRINYWPACGDAISGLGCSGLPVVRFLQNMTLSIMTSYAMAYEYSKQIYLLTNISPRRKGITVQKLVALLILYFHPKMMA